MDEKMEWVWWERRMQVLKSERDGTEVEVENTVRAHVDQYLEFRRSKTQTGKNRLGTYQTFRHRLNHFRNWIDPSATVESIDEQMWERFYLSLAAKVEAGDMEAGTMASVLGAAREFVRSRAEKRLIALPLNLNSRSLAVSPPIKEVKVFTNQEVQARLDEADERMKLYLLLGLNCGMYSVDIGNIKQAEVDWQAGRIRRKRSKTRGRSKDVPEVDYLLWRETFRLLKKFRTESGELALLNEDGRPLWHEYLKEDDNGDQKYVKSDAIKCLYFRLQKKKLKLHKAEDRKPFKTLRKTGASTLDQHEQYGRYAEYYLGETPKSMTARHYVQPSRTQFDEALRWLGRQFGIE